MPETTRQKRVTGRVMHEFKHGELKSGSGGRAGRVKDRRQAVAIALSEAGDSKYNSKRRNTRYLTRTEAKEAKGETAQQEREGRAKIGAAGKRESTPAMGGGDTRQELYAKAQRKGVEGRSKMTKQQLKNALGLK